ncbi:LLM class flavin-dependent oxidoreductase [Pseudonocardia acaciae]|uniref:LLM class flavin-dependent oxidoreductase n=1 Tax=Pseudonocardia acaciae TaxID=551276 RepID=UPI0004903707|nr:LLM class flavin-dependent oxidoreductase [Pseudonocardia acaciae]
MKLGLSLGMAGMGLAEQLAAAGRVERAGADSVASLEAGYDVFAVTSALAGVTARPRLFSGVATWARPPVAAARAAATVDELSGGRFVLGLGSMPRAWSRDYYGIDSDRPVARMREYVEVIRGALGSHARPFTHAGEHFSINGYRLPREPVRERVPIHLGATRPGMARLAGEVADGVLVNFVCTPDWLVDVVLPAVRGGEDVSGRRVERGLLVCCAVHDSPATAREWLRESFRGHLRVPYFYQVAAHAGIEPSETRRLAEAGDADGALAAIPDELLDAMGVAGSVPTVCARLAELAEHVDHIQLMPPRHLAGEALAHAIAGIVEVIQANVDEHARAG